MTQTCGNCKWAEWRTEGIGQCQYKAPIPKAWKVERWCIFAGDKGCKCWEKKA
jgi:hypothetical protein